MTRHPKGVLAVRFDVDSTHCCEVGVPRLMEAAERLGVRFTFFLNLGRTFSWRHTPARAIRKLVARQGSHPSHALPTSRKLRARDVLRTVLLNPALGRRYAAVFQALRDAGHELGLHGGTNHAVWQWGFSGLSQGEIARLLRPSLDDFRRSFGAPPRGFASPGFRFDDRVLAELEALGFEYTSDAIDGEPFRESSVWQVPVNVVGEGGIPLIERRLAQGAAEDAIVEEATEEVRQRRYALLYGHPFVEGVRADLIERVVRAVEGSHEVVTVGEYLARWREESGAAGPGRSSPPHPTSLT